MKRWAIFLAVLAVLGAVGYVAFQRYRIYIPGILSNLRDPIAGPQTITWAQGPATPTAAPADRPPNVIIILVDDLGINDLTFTGQGVVPGQTPTPNIDALAQNGAHAPVAYAANATCSPSRAAIMTGRYPTRFGFEFTAVPPAFAENLAHAVSTADAPVIFHKDKTKGLLPYPQMGVPAGEETVAEALAPLGYHSVHIGKWHLGEAQGLRPENQGFNESLGLMAGGGMFQPANHPDVVNAKLPWDPIDRFLWANGAYAVQFNGGQRFRPDGYLTDYFTNHAIQVIEANKNRPFFLYLSYTAPHTPLQATREDYDALAGIEDHNLRVYAAMIRAVDRGVGRIMQTLKDQGLDQNTLVMFMSDNGGAWYNGMPDLNRPYRGWKATFFEGGLRTPFFLHWPARIAAGSTIATPAHHIDVFATVTAAAGAPARPPGRLDGINLLPRAGEAAPPRTRTLFWRSGHYRVVRDGDWKLQLSERPARTWLFNLAADPTERTDLSAAEPAQVARLTALIEAHERGMPEPLWPALIEGPIRIDVPLNAPHSPEQDFVYWAN